jgi:hypothetical protein
MSHPNEYPIDSLEVHHPTLANDGSLEGSSLLRIVGAMRASKWVALGLIGLMLAAMVAASAALTETQTPCYQAYLMSGFNPQQTSFEEFRGLYGDTSLCAPGGRAH